MHVRQFLFVTPLQTNAIMVIESKPFSFHIFHKRWVVSYLNVNSTLSLIVNESLVDLVYSSNESKSLWKHLEAAKEVMVITTSLRKGLIMWMYGRAAPFTLISSVVRIYQFKADFENCNNLTMWKQWLEDARCRGSDRFSIKMLWKLLPKSSSKASRIKSQTFGSRCTV